MKKLEKTVMISDWLVILAFGICVLIMLTSCKPVQYVPVESIKIEYRESIFRDSIHLQDSIIIKEKGDTIRIEKYQYLYRYKLVRDSIFVNDTVRVHYPVEIEKPVKYVSGWQNFQIWCGRILLVAIIIFIIFKIKK